MAKAMTARCSADRPPTLRQRKKPDATMNRAEYLAELPFVYNVLVVIKIELSI